MKILGIETSCDDTGLALIDGKKIIYNKIIKQNHVKGVIPEFAARAHHIALRNHIKPFINEVNLIAYTNGPGLIGSLFVGSSFAKGLGLGKNIPLLAINHLVAHCLLPVWMYDIKLPALCLLISGGHTMLVEMRSLTVYNILSKSLDDAVGETFDKVARCIGLPYPGGPEIEKLSAQAMNNYKFNFPKIMEHSLDFSFSGLKTAAINMISESDCAEKKADFCLQFQEHIAKLLVQKIKKFDLSKYNALIISGGVSANKIIRNTVKTEIENQNINVVYLPIEHCTDNGLMIAATAQLLYPVLKTTNYELMPEANCMLKLF